MGIDDDFETFKAEINAAIIKYLAAGDEGSTFPVVNRWMLMLEHDDADSQNGEGPWLLPFTDGNSLDYVYKGMCKEFSDILAAGTTLNTFARMRADWMENDDDDEDDI